MGFGKGEQLALWLEKYRVANICGIEKDMDSFVFALERFQNHENVELNLGELPYTELGKYTKTIALDCAYHFKNRFEHFRIIQQSLTGEAIFVFSDLILAKDSLTKYETVLLKVVSLLTTIPYENWLNSTEYEKNVIKCGFSIVDRIDLSAGVLDGFSSANIWGAGKVSDKIKKSVTSKIIKILRNHGLIKYIIYKTHASEY